MLNRRNFLLAGAAGFCLSPLSLSAKTETPKLLSCRGDGEGHYFLTGITASGTVTFDIQLPGRGHSAVFRPVSSEAVVFARRPDDFLWVVDITTGKVVAQVTAPDERHFYGHGVFDADGRLLYATENDFETGQGVIGVYDAADGYRRVGEFPSQGVGPHELKLLGDGKTLVIANGGIRTHPDLGRRKLNIPEMQPNLAYLDSTSGKLLGRYQPPQKWHKLSIRHLDVQGDTVCIGMQYQGRSAEQLPLVALHRGEDELQFVRAPDLIQKRMKNYCGSVCIETAGETFAVSSPRGNLVTFWSVSDGRYLDSVDVADGCGVATGNGGFWLSSGEGELYRQSDDGLVRVPVSGVVKGGTVRWDNHLSSSIQI
ncbi:MAG: DUF1513 domain-containing protein [Chromatiales bacterium]|nr:DUF1513 domain-containing protein [Chromatiales bacterium]